MKSAHRLLTALLLAAVLLAVSPVAAKEQTVYGEGITLAESVTIGELLTHPDKYVDKLVRVEGKITDVCPKAGCWIDIQDDSRTDPIRFKVRDGVIVFPKEAAGRSVVAEGTFIRMELDREEAVSYLKHLAEEKKETFDASTVTEGMNIYRIQGSGATVY